MPGEDQPRDRSVVQRRTLDSIRDIKDLPKMSQLLSAEL